MKGSFGSKPVVCFEVEKVIGVSSEGNTRSYQVQWAPAWVSSFHLVGCEHLIQEFLQQAAHEVEEVEEEEVENEQRTPHQVHPSTDLSVKHCSKNLSGEYGSEAIPLVDEVQPLDISLEADCENAEGICIENVRSVMTSDQSDKSFDTPTCSNKLSLSQVDCNDHSTNSFNISVKVEDTEEERDPHDKRNRSISFFHDMVHSEVASSSSLLAFVSNIDTPMLSNTNEDGGETSNSGKYVKPVTAEPNSEWFVNTCQKNSDGDLPKDARYLCTVCNRQCLSRSHLTIHTRSHTGFKPFSCSYCDKAFAKKSNLKDHLRTHTGIKPYQCNLCNKAFAQRSNLKTHQRTHVRVKPYRCDVCCKTFSQHSALKKHLHTHIV